MKANSKSSKQVIWQAKYGPWAIVTGASEGIGREMALGLAEQGINLVLVARRQALLEQLKVELAKFGVEVRLIVADLAQDSEVEAVIAATSALDIGFLAACAGFGTSGRLIESSLENEMEMLDVNCRAVLAMCYHFGRRFARQKRGGIVLMSSLLAFQGVPLSANYAATKAYVQSLAEALNLELAPLGVDVIASAPGPVHSGFGARAKMNLRLATNPRQVARSTLSAIGHQSIVRPGWLSKLLESSLTLIPRWGRVRIMQSIMADMVKTQAGK